MFSSQRWVRTSVSNHCFLAVTRTYGIVRFHRIIVKEKSPPGLEVCFLGTMTRISQSKCDLFFHQLSEVNRLGDKRLWNQTLQRQEGGRGWGTACGREGKENYFVKKKKAIKKRWQYAAFAAHPFTLKPF